MPTTRAARLMLRKRSLQLSAPDAARLIRDAVAAGGEMWVRGSGGSMHPTIRHADPVLLAPLERAVRRGQIVLVPLGPRLMLHRVVAVQGDVVLTRGDARQRNDAPVARSAVVARAVAVRRRRSVTTLVLTLRFGIAPLMRFLLRETYRRARLLRATPKQDAIENLTRSR
jgi:Peptidase S24-like